MDLYRLHVSLQEIEPAIWRRIELSSQTTLKQFHGILQIAMGWENYHLHEYIDDGRRYGTPEPAWLTARCAHRSAGGGTTIPVLCRSVRYAATMNAGAAAQKPERSALNKLTTRACPPGETTELRLSGTNQKSTSKCPGSQVTRNLSAGQVGNIKSPASLQQRA
jgi:hypothetical protein